MSLIAALGWRGRLVRDKLAGRMGAVPWSLVMDEIKRRRELAWHAPRFAVVEEDPAAGLALMAAGEQRFWVPAGTYDQGLDSIYKEIFNPDHPHYYEHAGCRIRPGDIVIDAGACEGFFTRFALDRGARVIAVEPYSRMAEALRRTFAAEIAGGRVCVFAALLAGRDGSAELALNPMFPFEAHAAAEGETGGAREPVEALTLESIVARSGWDRCDFLKMDVEGAEVEVIAGAAPALARWRPAVSAAVYHHPANFCRIAASLRELGFRVEGKGITRLDGGDWRPVMLHAWSPDRAGIGA
jgi:FkbM family methyltransferase